MKYLLLITAFIIASGSSSLAQAPKNWITFASDAGGFSVLMPGPDVPVDKAETSTGASGPYTTHLFIQRSDKGPFLVGWVDYAPSMRLNVQGELAANRDNFVKGIKAKVTYEKPITLGTNLGIEFIAEAEGVTFKSRVYIVGRRPYMLVAGTYSGMNDAANVEKFLDSFKLKP